ncbi:hypothetical protein ACJQWK_08267 [Exserohilum turcicum]|uniref:Uncharacterized protein n=1 Tax=Exserohilum turcicum (strain 28A) TaxID=671987 RepID=R0K0X1_EXST2|nr:uncharacterized protein SETTUDRAFT_153564 [Exserohilum turcica Et28A]EOA86778.1 hypothetical protein SETTUDRAFT_153564 [Exserohilum turcica Et28A]
MGGEYKDDPSFKAWGPFISPNYKNEPITQTDIIIASTVWGLTLLNCILATHLAIKQTKESRSPLRSVYIWMIWLEMAVCFVMGLECFLHLLKYISPSFAFYFTILFWWCIQVQLLLQIIINRIRVILPDRRRSRWIMIVTATFVTAINISVFNIWIPARLQISPAYHLINEYWDRIEKGLYLLVDAILNWYFLRTVKANLIKNGLTKYNDLVKFNQKIVILSLCMDVMIIAAMSIPNSFVYIQFHPLAYMVKLNIEMTMANLIKRIAISTSRKTGKASIAQEFRSSSEFSTTTGHQSHHHHSHHNRDTHKSQHASVHELTSFASYTGDVKAGERERIVSFEPRGNQIKETREIIIRSEANPFYENNGQEADKTVGTYHMRNTSQGGVLTDGAQLDGRSMDSIAEGDESTKSVKSGKSTNMSKKPEDSDDEAALVGNKTWWPRRDS